MERSRGIRPNDYARCLRGQTKSDGPSGEVRRRGLLLWRKGLLVVVMVERRLEGQSPVKPVPPVARLERQIV
jgi:hypothetical protein